MRVLFECLCDMFEFKSDDVKKKIKYKQCIEVAGLTTTTNVCILFSLTVPGMYCYFLQFYFKACSRSSYRVRVF